MYAAIYGIASPVEQVPNPEVEKDGNVLLRAVYTGIGLYETFDECYEITVPMVADRFGGSAHSGDVTSTVIMGEKSIKEARFGHTDYRPLGQKEIPLMFISVVELDIAQDIEKFFVVPASSIVPTSYE